MPLSPALAPPKRGGPPPLILTMWSYVAMVTHQRVVGMPHAELSAVKNINLSAEPEQI